MEKNKGKVTMSELPINQVVTGDCREVMAEWSSDCIDFVMFSPPFWGLRDYGEEAESVWGGDKDCNHIWNEEVDAPNKRKGEKPPGKYGAKETVGSRGDYPNSKFCSKCGAWRGQLGLEPDYRMYVQHLVEVGREIKRILKPSGSWYLNLGDTYSTHASKRSGQFGKEIKEGFDDVFTRKKPDTGLPEKCKMLMPYRVALALVDDGWICRNDIIWLKPNPMPSSVKDRLNTTTERIFHFVNEKQYYYDLDVVREPHKKESIKRDKSGYPDSPMKGRYKVPKEHREEVSDRNDGFCHPKGKNPGDVIEQTTEPFPEAHFAIYPPKLCEKPIKSSCPPKVCVECGEPYVRKTEKKITFHSGSGKAGNPPNGKYGKDWEQAKSGNYDIRMGPKTSINFKGWEKKCNCSAAKTKPGIVLDPMCGAGSTLVKAKQLGRRYIGIEISEEYAEIARNRLKLGDEEYKRRKRKERRLRREAEGTANLEEFV